MITDFIIYRVTRYENEVASMFLFIFTIFLLPIVCLTFILDFLLFPVELIIFIKKERNKKNENEEVVGE